MIHWIHNNPNYIINMYFIWNGGIESIQHQYESNGYYKMPYACVPVYILHSHSKITTHANKNNHPSIIIRLRSHVIHWIHNNPNYIMNTYFISSVGLEAIQHQYESTGYKKTSSACVPLYSLYSHSKNHSTHTNQFTDPSIIIRLRSHMTHWIHHNPNYIINMYFIWNGGIESIQHQYESNGYYKMPYACVPMYILHSHSKITTHANKNNHPSTIIRLRSHVIHW
jgi:hypothetical protein